MRKTTTEIIEETAAFYNSGNRSSRPRTEEEKSNDGKDDYLCLYNGPEGRKCAFARLVKDEELAHLSEGSSAQDNSLAYPSILKDEYAGYPSRFYQALQRLHDDAEIWDEKGLTPAGQAVKAQMINEWKDVNAYA